jgi:hypothetical protein
MKSELKERYPLSWPEGWPRTRPQDRKPQAAWKKTANQYRDALEKELTRMESPSFVISSNVPLTQRGAMTPGIEPLDVGVALYFTRKVKEDFSWQDALDIHDPAPTEAQIDAAYRRLSLIYHPDKGGDIQMFQALNVHRKNALNWVNRKTNQNFDYVLACDQFNAVRLNMEAICLTLKAIRQIERCGTSSLLERAFKGFAAIAEHASGE